MSATADEHGNLTDDDWAPESPILRGEVRTPDVVHGVDAEGWVECLADELPHRVRRENDMAGEDPDPGYDPDGDDLLPGGEV